MIETTQAIVILVQETGGYRGGASAQKCLRVLERPSGDQQEGAVHRIMVQRELWKKVTVLQDTRHALLVLIQTNMGWWWPRTVICQSRGERV